MLEARKHEIEAALAELRRTYSSFYARIVGRPGLTGALLHLARERRLHSCLQFAALAAAGNTSHAELQGACR